MEAMNSIEEELEELKNIRSYAKHIQLRAEELYAEKQSLLKVLKQLIGVTEKDEINKDHLDTILRRARNVVADVDPSIEKCDCCY